MKKEYLFAAGAVVCWSTVAPITKLLLNEMSAGLCLFLTTSIAALTLFIYNILRGNLKKFGSYRPADWLRLCIMGFLGFFVYNAAYYTGLTLLSAQDACVINYLWPLMTVIFSCFILHERFTAAKLAAALLSFAGAAVVATKGDFGNFAKIDLRGVLFCLLAALSYGLFSAFNKKYDYDQEPAMAVYFTVPAVISGIFLIFSGTPVHISGIQAAGILWMGVVVSAAGYLIWCLAINRGNTAKISNLAYITPFLSMVLSCIMLKEPFSLPALLGLILIILGIAVQLRGERVPSRKHGSALSENLSHRARH